MPGVKRSPIPRGKLPVEWSPTQDNAFELLDQHSRVSRGLVLIKTCTLTVSETLEQTSKSFHSAHTSTLMLGLLQFLHVCNSWRDSCRTCLTEQIAFEYLSRSGLDHGDWGGVSLTTSCSNAEPRIESGKLPPAKDKATP